MTTSPDRPNRPADRQAILMREAWGREKAQVQALDAAKRSRTNVGKRYWQDVAKLLAPPPCKHDWKGTGVATDFDPGTTQVCILCGDTKPPSDTEILSYVMNRANVPYEIVQHTHSRPYAIVRMVAIDVKRAQAAQ